MTNSATETTQGSTQGRKSRYLVTTDSKANGQPIPKLPSLPRARYVNPEFFRAEIDSVFRKSWLLLAHACEFENIGSYKLFDMPSLGPIVIVRGKDEKLRAFLNSCPHRGATVLSDSEGCGNVMICQYHGWTYNLEGNLIGVTNAEAFPDIDKKQYRLPAIRCEQWGGFVYVNFDQGAPSLLDWLGSIATTYPQVEEVPDAPLRLLYQQSWEVACNWKLMMDNFNEGYHINVVHAPSIKPVFDQTRLSSELHANGCVTQYNYYRKRQEQSGDSFDQSSNVLQMPNIEDEKEFDDKHVGLGMFPNTLLVISKNFFNFIQFLPIGIDRCKIDVSFYVRDWGDGPMPEEWKGSRDGMMQLVSEDTALMPGMQRSIETAPDLHIPLGGYEIPMLHIHATIDKMIGTDNIPSGCRIADPNFLQQWITP